jgi:hypothetical protein
MGKKTRELSARLLRFGREYTSGLSRRDLERMFDEDAVHAFTVLAGEKPGAGEESFIEGLKTFFLQARAFFLGLAFKLSPARRVLFTVSALLPLGGLFFGSFNGLRFGIPLVLDFSPVWFLLSIAGLTLLLALELVDRLRVRDELDVARQLQRELLPAVAPRPPGYEIAHSYTTANEIGGDYYDFLRLDDGRLVVTVGDASGHGIGAGLLMAISNATLKTAIDLDPSPSRVLGLMNRTLCRTGGPRAFMALFYGVLDTETGRLEYASAGQPFPLLRRASGDVEELGRGAFPLGIRPGTAYQRDEISLEAGDVLVLYSDGLPELVGGPEDDAFGFERLRRLLDQPGDAREIHDRIVADVRRHLGNHSQSDDLTLVVICRHEKPDLPPLPAG